MPEDKNKDLSSTEDSRLFRDSMADVKPISSDKYDPAADQPKPRPHKKRFEPPVRTLETPEYSPSEIQSDDRLFYAKQGIRDKTIRQLKRGTLDVDDRIDLHGLTQPEAHQYLDDFLIQQTEQHHRCILVVHGKGMGSLSKFPVLKNMVFNQLKAHSNVLALSSARQRDGGAGALYVLLKSS
ncbi:MAG: Smr/MutS family protein [Cycloclasticus sp.]